MTSTKPRRSRSVAQNSFLNIIGYGVAVAVSLVTVPFYLDAVGAARFGVLSIFWVMLGYFAGLDLGLGRATTNETSRLGRRDHQGRADVILTSLVGAGGVGLVAAGVLIGATWIMLDRFLNLSAGLESEAMASLPWLALGVPALTLGAVTIGGLEGEERFVAVNVIESLTAAGLQLIPLAIALTVTDSVEWLVVGAVGVNILRFVSSLVWLRAVGSFTRPRFDRARFGRLLRYGSWVSVSALVSPLLTTIDRPLIGAISGVRAVTVYAIPYNLTSRLLLVAYSLTRALFPRVSSLEGQEATTLGRDALLSLAALITPLVIVGLATIEPFLELWIGGDLAHDAAPVGEVLLVAMWLNCLALVPYTYVQGTGRPDVTAKFHLIELPAYLVLLVVSTTLFGVIGAAAAAVCRTGLDLSLLLWASKFGSGTTARLALGAVIVGITCVGAVAFQPDSLAGLATFVTMTLSTMVWSIGILPGRVRSKLVGRVPQWSAVASYGRPRD